MMSSKKDEDPQTFNVRVPAAQAWTAIGMVVVIVSSLWVAVRDLTSEISRLAEGVEKMSLRQEQHETRLDQHDIQMLGIEHDVEVHGIWIEGHKEKGP